MGNQYSYNYNQRNSIAQPMKDFQPERYQGMWYEQAKTINIPWQKDCCYATAEYTYTDSKIELVNTCYNNQGKHQIKGIATMVPTKCNYAMLKVKFENMPGCGDYYVYYTDYDNFAIVGSPRRGYLWILSRERIISKENKMMLFNKARCLGYNIHLLKFNVFPQVMNLPKTVKANKEYHKLIYKDKCTEHYLMSLKPGQMVDWETHIGSQTTIVQQGEATFKLEGQTFVLNKAGDSIVIEPGVKHFFQNTGKKDLKLISIYAPKD